MYPPTCGWVAAGATSTWKTRVPGANSVAEAHRELVERCAEHDGDVGLARRAPSRASAPKPPVDAEVELRSGEDPAAERRRGGERAGRIGERAERVAGAGDPRAAAGEQERALARRRARRRASRIACAANGPRGASGAGSRGSGASGTGPASSAATSYGIASTVGTR